MNKVASIRLSISWKRDLGTLPYIFAGMMLIAVLAAAQHYIRYGQQVEEFSIGLNFTYQLIVFGSIALMALPVFYGADLFPVKKEKTIRVIFIHLGLSLGFAILHCLLCNVLLYLTNLAPGIIFPRFWAKYLTTILHFWLISYVVLVAIRAICQRPSVLPAGNDLKEDPRLFIFDKVMVPLLDILFLEAYGHYVKIHTCDKTYVIRSSLKQVQAQLPAHQFCRIHRSFIVQLTMIRTQKADRSGGLFLGLEGGKEVRVSRSYRPFFQQKLADLSN